MKKTFIIGSLTLLGIFLFSCTKELDVVIEEDNPPIPAKYITATATIDPNILENVAIFHPGLSP